MAITILVTDAALRVVGDPIRTWSSVDVTLRRNAPGSGVVELPATPAILEQLLAGRRLVVVRNREVWAAGPMDAEPGEYQWEAAPGAKGSGTGTIDVPFSTDEAYLADRVTYPDPAAASTAQTAAAYWTSTGNAEVLMRSLVNLNAGPGALLVRRVPGLALGALAGVGTSIKVSTRFEPLTDALRSAALAGGGLAFRVRQVGQQLLFEVTAPRDLTSSVRFSRGLGNLRGFKYTPEAPTCTVAIVGGQGEGTARTVRELVDAGAVTRWRRIERFVDQRQSSDAVELDQAAAEALADGAERTGLATETIDTDRQRYGVHYLLNDLVSVELAPGLVVPDVVNEVRLTARAGEGERVTPRVGLQSLTATEPEWLAALRGVYRRLINLEVI